MQETEFPAGEPEGQRPSESPAPCATRAAPAIDPARLDEEFLRASGPGGQRLNKVETAVRLRYRAAEAGLPAAVLARLAALAGRRMTRQGVIVLTAQRHRTRARNRADALARLQALLDAAAAPPPPQRRPTRPGKAAQQRRLDGKTRHGATKRLRAKPVPES